MVDPLARYFFHLQDGQFLPDRTGTECASMAEVKARAMKLSADIVIGEDDRLLDGIDWQITAVDEAGDTVFTLNFHARSYLEDRDVRAA